MMRSLIFQWNASASATIRQRECERRRYTQFARSRCCRRNCHEGNGESNRVGGCRPDWRQSVRHADATAFLKSTRGRCELDTGHRYPGSGIRESGCAATHSVSPAGKKKKKKTRACQKEIPPVGNYSPTFDLRTQNGNSFRIRCRCRFNWQLNCFP